MRDSEQIDSIVAQWREERPDLDVTEMAMFGKVQRLAVRLRVELAGGYASCGLSEGEFDVLSALRRAGHPYELPPSEVAQHTMVTAGAVSKRVDKLTEAGLVTQRPATGDRRRRVVALTPAGLERINAAIEAHVANEKRLVAGMTQRDLEQMEAILSRWLDAFPSA